MNTRQKISAGLATAAMTMGAITPAVFAGSGGISGNGAFSKNAIYDFSYKEKIVHQSNTTNANTYIKSHANTGGNNASFNSGGKWWKWWEENNTSQQTGNATSNVGVSVSGGDNHLIVEGCNTCESHQAPAITDNGAFSHNTIVQVDVKKVAVEQNNTMTANTAIHSEANTGGNNASFNSGDVHQDTGNATSNVGVSVSGGDNKAELSHDCGCSSTSGDTDIMHNDAFSHNTVVSTQESKTTVEQSNNTTANTIIHSSANTGGNSSSFNSGSVTQTTGDATSNVGVSVSGGDNELH